MQLKGQNNYNNILSRNLNTSEQCYSLCSRAAFCCIVSSSHVILRYAPLAGCASPFYIRTSEQSLISLPHHPQCCGPYAAFPPGHHTQQPRILVTAILVPEYQEIKLYRDRLAGRLGSAYQGSGVHTNPSTEYSKHKNMHDSDGTKPSIILRREYAGLAGAQHSEVCVLGTSVYKQTYAPYVPPCALNAMRGSSLSIKFMNQNRIG